jgi:3',5'-cyclic AMP phosphodiesterase CpdA
MNRRQFLRLGAYISGGLISGLPTRFVYGSESDPSLRILFFSDVHAMLEHDAPVKLRETAKRMADIPFDLVIGGGDFVHGGFGSQSSEMEPRFAQAKSFLEAIGHPVEAVLGNHDMVGVRPADGSEPNPEPTRQFSELTGHSRFWRRFDRNGYRFFVLQSVEPVDAPERYHGRISTDQLAWIKSELTSTPPDMPLVICSHIPLRTTFKQVQDGPLAPLPPNLVVQNANDVLELFEDHRLLLVLQGHLHVNESIRWNQTEFLMGGAVSGAWWKGANQGTAPGFGLVHLGPPNRARWEYFGKP